MGFFKDFKEDASQAMKELMPQDDEVLDEEGTDEDDLVVNTLEDELDVESELSKLNGLLESVAKEETPVKEPAPETTQEKTTKAVTNKEEPFMSMEKETSVNPINLGGKAESVMPPITTPTSTPSSANCFTCFATLTTVASSKPVCFSPARASPLSFNNTLFMAVSLFFSYSSTKRLSTSTSA